MPSWLEHVVDLAHDALNQLEAEPSPSDALKYLRRRGVSHTEVLKHKIGYAGPSFTYPQGTEEFNIWARNYLHEAILFPVMSLSGEVIGLQLRHLTEQADNRPYRQHYAVPRELHPFAFGLYQSLDSIYNSRSVVIVEGVFDYFAIKAYVPNCIAIMTSGVSVSCRKFFKRFTPTVVALLDMDNPGKEGISRLIEGASGFNVLSFDYSEKDPAALLEKGKVKELERLASNMRIVLGLPRPV